MNSHITPTCRLREHGRNQRRRLHSSSVLVLLLALTALVASPTIAQQATDGDAAKQPTTRKKPAGRLPAYFAAVVSPEQRVAIYKLQADYEAQMEELRAQLDALTVQRDKAIDEVLQPEQLAEVTKKREEAKKKREARANARSETKTATDG